MVANQNPDTATALPVHYDIVVNTTQLTKDDIQNLIYQQCYNYYGFQGPIKTPAAAMYAHKLAHYALNNKIVGKDTEGTVNQALSNILHFIWSEWDIAK